MLGLVHTYPYLLFSGYSTDTVSQSRTMGSVTTAMGSVGTALVDTILDRLLIPPGYPRLMLPLFYHKENTVHALRPHGRNSITRKSQFDLEFLSWILYQRTGSGSCNWSTLIRDSRIRCIRVSDGTTTLGSHILVCTFGRLLRRSRRYRTAYQDVLLQRSGPALKPHGRTKNHR